MVLNITDIDETTWVATNAAIATLQAALNALSLGSLASRTLTAFRESVDDTRPASSFAQREVGLRFHYIDDVTGDKYHFTLPCPDLDIVAEAGTDQVDLEEITLAAAVAAIEAVAKSPDGNAITITRGVIVGRRS